MIFLGKRIRVEADLGMKIRGINIQGKEIKILRVGLISE